MSDMERPAKIPRFCGSESIADTTKLFPLLLRDEDGILKSAGKRSVKLIMDCCSLPKENGSSPQGEDSYFICDCEQVFGVADGVGGWAKKGIDAGEYARELMLNSATEVKELPRGSVNPLSVLKEAYSKTKAQGSSTACIVALREEDNSLRCANVGDSGFMVIRGDSIIYRSQTQQRSFNCPFQLGNHSKSDTPNSAIEFKVEIEEGDVIVAGTDGLFDNLFDENIIQAVKEMTGYIGIYPYGTAWAIAEMAKMISKDKYLVTPFSLGAEMAGYTHFGGKIDDITVVVAYVVSSSWGY
ncbi:probable protein phosphatase 2C 80 [Macadamia integrifolia]|uniref:probable protein phosphatase 2C 80 n=1 Tax=Macadamia integrifolia TaxID=60698 RepID=UPI001C531C6E|nr:probable protein phosphatase 2C 80 [Macadamia integrifolia]